MIKKFIQKQIQHLILYFIPKRIVVTTCYPAGLFVKASDIKGKKYITIAVTNHAVKHEPNAAVIYHVPSKYVIGIRKSITPFEKWYYSKVLNKQCPKKRIKALAH